MPHQLNICDAPQGSVLDHLFIQFIIIILYLGASVSRQVPYFVLLLPYLANVYNICVFAFSVDAQIQTNNELIL